MYGQIGFFEQGFLCKIETNPLHSLKKLIKKEIMLAVIYVFGVKRTERFKNDDIQQKVIRQVLINNLYA